VRTGNRQQEIPAFAGMTSPSEYSITNFQFSITNGVEADKIKNQGLKIKTTNQNSK
jgi:hypothetical protein